MYCCCVMCLKKLLKLVWSTSHYFSSPGLGWDAMLKITGIKLEKIDNIDMHCLLKKE